MCVVCCMCVCVYVSLCVCVCVKLLQICYTSILCHSIATSFPIYSSRLSSVLVVSKHTNKSFICRSSQIQLSPVTETITDNVNGENSHLSVVAAETLLQRGSMGKSSSAAAEPSSLCPTMPAHNLFWHLSTDTCCLCCPSWDSAT